MIRVTNQVQKIRAYVECHYNARKLGKLREVAIDEVETASEPEIWYETISPRKRERYDAADFLRDGYPGHTVHYIGGRGYSFAVATSSAFTADVLIVENFGEQRHFVISICT